MWFMPSYGRPQRLEELLKAPGGWPNRVTVLVNEDDPERERYQQVVDRLRMQRNGIVPWRLEFIPKGSRCADAHRYASTNWPNEPFYGLLCDDQWPITPLWHEFLVEAAGQMGIAGPNGEASFPLLRNVVVLGGSLVRAMGSLVPAPVAHNFEDNIWDDIASEFHLLRPLKDVYVEHRHWRSGAAKHDATYERGSKDFEADRVAYERWRDSPEANEMNIRIATMLGVKFAEVDTKNILLEIVVPIQDHLVDAIFHKSLMRTILDLQKCGVTTRLTQAMGGSHIGKARERVLWAAMNRDPKPTHLLWIDSDMGWEPKLVTRQLAADHEFSAVVGVKKTEKLDFCCNFLPENVTHPGTGYLGVEAVGFAFVLMKISVIEKLCAAYPELAYETDDGRKEFALFMDMLRNKKRFSEDFSFCYRWRDIGGEIWVDLQGELIHSGMKHYTGCVGSLFEFEEPQREAAE